MSTTSLQEEVLSFLANLSFYQVRIPSHGEVLGYLSRYPDLAAHLPTIAAETRKEFGHEAELSLELYKDPEIDDHYLTLYIRLPEYGSDIMDRIERVSRSFEKPLTSSSGNLLLTTDFRRLRRENAI